MIDIRDEKDCVGCNACSQICPRQCIEMKSTLLGFRYPEVNLSQCIDCHLCERVCPVIRQADPRRPIEVYAAKNPDTAVRLGSSSGGAFMAIAGRVIAEGGVVFGARFDDSWNVVHDYADSIDALRQFQGSKYVQSEIGDSFLKAEQFLKAGRRVLFSGTPCQLAALNLFLRKDYGDRLIKLDVVCHGVPGPAVWRAYLDHVLKGLDRSLKDVRHISFRDKRQGWRKFGLAIETDGASFYEPLDRNLYIRVFLNDLDLRPSCYTCPAKCGKSHTDITLADYWKLRKFHADIFDETGVSLLMANTPLGQEIIGQTDLRLTPSAYEYGLYGNPAIEQSASMPLEREDFMTFFSRKDFTAISTLTDRKPTK